MTTQPAALPAFHISGDGAAIDFTNTADWHASEAPVELLTDYGRLVAWAEAAALLSVSQADAMRHAAAERPQDAAAALSVAIDMRETLYRIFSAVAAGAPAPPADMARLNAALPQALLRLRIQPAHEAHSFVWAWEDGPADLTWFLSPVVWTAAELLVGQNLARLRECAGHPCGWIFLDHSRNRSRRWCSMAGCGNRAKARRHYARQKRGEIYTPPGERVANDYAE